MPGIPALEDTQQAVLAAVNLTNAKLDQIITALGVVNANLVMVIAALTVANASLVTAVEKLTAIEAHALQSLDYEDRKLYAITHGSGLRRNQEYPGPGWQ